MRNARAQGRGPGGAARGSIEGRFMKDGNTIDESPGFRYVY
jgi:hypothetical protein